MPHTTSQKAMIAEAAYFKSERRGFTPGHEMTDWLEAEREVEAILNGNGRPAPAPAPVAKKPKSRSSRSTTSKR
jgi:hypothetical protein